MPETTVECVVASVYIGLQATAFCEAVVVLFPFFDYFFACFDFEEADKSSCKVVRAVSLTLRVDEPFPDISIKCCNVQQKNNQLNFNAHFTGKTVGTFFYFCTLQ